MILGKEPQEWLQGLYDDEVNFSISCFFDSGFTVKLGDEHNGFLEEADIYGFENAVDWLVKMAIKHYSDFNLVEGKETPE